ncbi:MAG: dihydrodipicolinate synthase family protein [Peptoniphilaceae bacterium]
MANFDMEDIKGVIPAMVTPFDKEENLDEEKTRQLIDFLIDHKVDGLYIGGSTGEGMLMSINERKKLTEIVCDQVNGRIPVIIHVGAISTKLSMDLAKHAYESGADAISSLPPFYWNFDSESIYQYYKDISESTPLPMIIYNVSLAGLMDIDMIYKLAKIKNVKGIKYTSISHFKIQIIKDNLGKEFKVYSGSDEMALSGLLHGADGLIGSFYSMIPDLFINLSKSVEEENINTAKQYQKLAVDIIISSLKYDYYSAIKLGIKWMGLDIGVPRRPFKPLTEKEVEEYVNSLDKLKDKYPDIDCSLLDSLPNK